MKFLIWCSTVTMFDMQLVQIKSSEESTESIQSTPPQFIYISSNINVLKLDEPLV